jgi:hypothetical protein
MIAYAPLDDIPPPPTLLAPPVVPAVPLAAQKKGHPVLADTTECSWLLMFFVIGVIGLSVKDMSGK